MKSIQDSALKFGINQIILAKNTKYFPYIGSFLILITLCLYFIPIFDSPTERITLFNQILSGNIVGAVSFILFTTSFILIIINKPNLDYPSIAVFSLSFILAIALLLGIENKASDTYEKTTGYNGVAVSIFMLPLLAIMLQFSLLIDDKRSQERNEFFKKLSRIGSPYQLFSWLANKYQFQFQEGFGKEPTRISGSINGIQIKVTSPVIINLQNDFPYTFTVVSSNHTKHQFPSGIIAKKNFNQEYISVCNSQSLQSGVNPIKISDEIVLYTNNAQNQSWFNTVLERHKGFIQTLTLTNKTYSGFFFFEGNILNYIKPYMLNTSNNLTSNELESAIHAIIFSHYAINPKSPQITTPTPSNTP